MTSIIMHHHRPFPHAFHLNFSPHCRHLLLPSPNTTAQNFPRGRRNYKGSLPNYCFFLLPTSFFPTLYPAISRIVVVISSPPPLLSASVFLHSVPLLLKTWLMPAIYFPFFSPPAPISSNEVLLLHFPRTHLAPFP